VGQLAADEAKPFDFAKDAQTLDLRYSEEPDSASSSIDPTWNSPLLYTEPEPPGRDVFSVYSKTSGRLLQIAYHAHRREKLFAANILPTLADLRVDRATQWSIFDLNCVIPGGMKLRTQHLNAGDLGLTFADRYSEVTIRQIAVAQLALQRQSLDGWIASQQKASRRYHHPTGNFADTTLELHDRNLPARLSRMHRRLRYALMFNQPKTIATIGAHDAERDRLILLHGTDESLLQVIGATVGLLSPKSETRNPNACGERE
jgi:hypothetical protein